MTVKEIRDTLYEQLIGTGWDTALRYFIKCEDFEPILQFLIDQVEDGNRFTPALKSIFQPFISTPLASVKVIFLVPEPNGDPRLNTGLAIDSNAVPKVSEELYRLRVELNSQYPAAIGNPKLWANQGVLLLNCSLTTQIGAAGRHAKIWKEFLYCVLDVLNRQSYLFVLFGDIEVKKSLAKHHSILQVKGLPKNNKETWESEGLFRKINEHLKSKNLSKINW